MGRALWFVAATCLVAALAGCGTAAADAGRSFGDGELINDIANRLARADTLAYTAIYSRTDNASVSITHSPDPARTAYHFPGGMVLLMPDKTTSCKIVNSTGNCTTSPPPLPDSVAATVTNGIVEQGGLIRPETAITLLTQVARNADAIISEEDRTLAGTNATCISITGIPVDDRFSACVTDDGLLGAFHGSVSGILIDVDLTHYEMDTVPTAFALPSAAPARTP